MIIKRNCHLDSKANDSRSLWMTHYCTVPTVFLKSQPPSPVLRPRLVFLCIFASNVSEIITMILFLYSQRSQTLPNLYMYIYIYRICIYINMFVRVFCIIMMQKYADLLCFNHIVFNTATGNILVYMCVESFVLRQGFMQPRFAPNYVSEDNLELLIPPLLSFFLVLGLRCVSYSQPFRWLLISTCFSSSLLRKVILELWDTCAFRLISNCLPESHGSHNQQKLNRQEYSKRNRCVGCGLRVRSN